MQSSGRLDADLLISIGSQGTAALAIAMTLLSALISKGALQSSEAISLLNAAAASAEKSTDALGGSYAKAVGETIRQMTRAIAVSSAAEQRH